MDYGFDNRLADQWNSILGIEEAEGVDFWPLCRILASAGILIPNQEDIAAAEIGPFRLATTANAEVIGKIFIETAFRTAIELFRSSETSQAAIKWGLDFATQLFVAVINKGGFVNDRVAWIVLLHIKAENRLGQAPTRQELLASLADRPVGQERAPTITDIEAALDALAGWKSITGAPTPLIVAQDDRRYRTLV